MAKQHIVIVAGEASGDLHAASLVRALKSDYPTLNLEVTAIGGQHLQAEGVTLLSDLARFGVTGLTEVLRHALTLRRAYKAMQHHLEEHRPDLLILVDYPGFNLRLATYAKKKLGLRVLYYVSPQLWAWKPARIHTIQQAVDHMAVIFPFEKKIYDDAGVPCSFVGHPLLENLVKTPSYQEARRTLKLDADARIIALLPGSRNHEINQHLPILNKTAKRLLKQDPKLQFIIPIANTLTKADFTPLLDIPVTYINEQAVEVMSASDCVVVASGTASLECALLEKPMCIIYKASLLTYVVAIQVIRVKYLGLCNLIANRMIVPELLQQDCTPDELVKVIQHLLHHPKNMIQHLQQMKAELNTQAADCSLATLVHDLLQNSQKRTCVR